MSASTFSLNSLLNSIRIQNSLINCRPSKPNCTSSSSTSSTPTNDDSIEKDSSFIKAPTAPWMKCHLLVEKNQILKFSGPRKKMDPKFIETDKNGKALFGKEGGGRGKKAMKKVYQGFEKLQMKQSFAETEDSQAKMKFKFSSEGSFGDESWNLYEVNESVEVNKSKFGKVGIDNVVAYSKKLQRKQSSFETEESQAIFNFKFSFDDSVEENKNKLGKFGIDSVVAYSKKMPWEKDEKLVFKRVKKERVKSAAELSIDGVVLERLRGEAKMIKKWVKVKKAGVTQSVVDQIRSIWWDNELAMVKFDLPLCRNMERAQEIIESKTGGFVVWVNKDELFVYRGCDYHRFLDIQVNSSMIWNNQDTEAVQEVNCNERSQDELLGKTENDGDSVSLSGTLYEREADRMLDGLGPRFIDWWGKKPLPVDADLLAEVVPGFKPPLRLCPPGVRSKLTDDELTRLRMHARSLPTHFVLGRNRKLQGMAVAILKLWEKCHIAKIALKFGALNTNNEQMANELKLLTGGTLILRNKFMIILYRGNDFLPPRVADLVLERESDLTRYQQEEEAARLVANVQIIASDEHQGNSSIIGTFSEFQSIHSECMTLENGNGEVELELRTQKKRIEEELRRERQKLFILEKKIEKSENDLLKINLAWQPSEPSADQEVLTDEERECLRAIGLKMESTLILGRRGVFDGVIEGLHQHWKHKEVVKVITMQRRFPQIIYTAKMLTAESGGILVSVDKLKEGHAIIIYRGKNYVRPALVGNKLPNKIDALQRSILMQRIGSMKFFANQEEQKISSLMDKLSALEEKFTT